jgi:hypothetical protein
MSAMAAEPRRRLPFFPSPSPPRYPQIHQSFPLQKASPLQKIPKSQIASRTNQRVQIICEQPSSATSGRGHVISRARASYTQRSYLAMPRTLRFLLKTRARAQPFKPRRTGAVSRSRSQVQAAGTAQDPLIARAKVQECLAFRSVPPQRARRRLARLLLDSQPSTPSSPHAPTDSLPGFLDHSKDREMSIFVLHALLPT